MPHERVTPNARGTDAPERASTHAAAGRGMAWWRRRLYNFVARRQTSAAEFLRIPPDRVVNVDEDGDF